MGAAVNGIDKQYQLNLLAYFVPTEAIAMNMPA